MIGKFAEITERKGRNNGAWKGKARIGTIGLIKLELFVL